MYHTVDEIEVMFKAFAKLKALVIVGEGSDNDLVREDLTTMYAFRSRLEKNGCIDRNFLIKKQAGSEIYEYFAMW